MSEELSGRVNKVYWVRSDRAKEVRLASTTNVNDLIIG